MKTFLLIILFVLAFGTGFAFGKSKLDRFFIFLANLKNRILKK